MNKPLVRPVYSLLIGMLLTVPFVMLEAANTAGFSRGFPMAVFVALLVSATVVAFMVLTAMRLMKAGRSSEQLTKAAVLVVLAVPFAMTYATMVVDQMPCFLGGRGC